MKIKIINPVPDLSAETVDGMRVYLEAALDPDTEIIFEPVAKGFRSIETEAQGVINGAEILRLVMKAQDEDCDGIFINCFDDPALIAARELKAGSRSLRRVGAICVHGQREGGYHHH